jgi:prolyl 4-hydroxylase
MKNPNFIGSWNIEPISICDDFICYFESNVHRQEKGITHSGIKLDIKDSVDITIAPLEMKNNIIFKNYTDELFKCYLKYVEEWPILEEFVPEVRIGPFNIQKYSKGQHFKKIHCERSGAATMNRVFAFMTYLNDVQEGGSTYFSHYDLEIQPKKGLTLIWPAEWTHAHRGNILKAGNKYIITGWMDFPI